MSRKANFNINLNLDPALPPLRRQNAHAMFHWVQSLDPAQLDERGRDRMAQSRRLKSLTPEMVDDAINDLCNSGNVTIRLNHGIAEASIARGFVLHLVEGGDKWA